MGASKIFIVAWAVVAGALFWGASSLRGPLDALGRQSQMIQPGNVAAADRPDIVLLNIIPGGLKCFAVTYLEVQSQMLMDKGRYYDANQKISLICKLMPHFSGVWKNGAWNMAYNISAATHTPEERWLWVYNGATLLRDEGIPLNPYSLVLYKELGWVFWHKMGQTQDEMHWSYSQRWAARMHYVLGRPPLGATRETVAAMESIAQAPLDRSPSKQGKERVQADRLRWIIDPDEKLKTPDAGKYFDPQAQQYARLLAQYDVKIDDTLLVAYNRFSLDDSVALGRNDAVHKPASPAEEAICKLINDKQFAPARRTLLSFVRAQILWNEYKMDPQFMKDLMDQYGPLDWRLVQTQGLYWVSYGMKVCRARGQIDIDTLNTSREVLNTLKDMVSHGRLVYQENVDRPDEPIIEMYSDWRFIETAQKQHLECIEEMRRTKAYEFQANDLRAGHENFLIEAILMLYAGQRRDENGNLLAQYYFDWTKEHYERPDDPRWNKDLRSFVIDELNREGAPILDRALTQISISIQAAHVFGAKGDIAASNERMDYAQLVYKKYQASAPDRNKFRITFDDMAFQLAAVLVGDPAYLGEDLPLLDRIRIYQSRPADQQVIIYATFGGALSRACQAEGLDFDRSFPRPAGLDRFLEQQGVRNATTQPAGVR